MSCIGCYSQYKEFILPLCQSLTKCVCTYPTNTKRDGWGKLHWVLILETPGSLAPWLPHPSFAISQSKDLAGLTGLVLWAGPFLRLRSAFRRCVFSSKLQAWIANFNPKVVENREGLETVQLEWWIFKWYESVWMVWYTNIEYTVYISRCEWFKFPWTPRNLSEHSHAFRIMFPRNPRSRNMRNSCGRKLTTINGDGTGIAYNYGVTMQPFQTLLTNIFLSFPDCTCQWRRCGHGA